MRDATSEHPGIRFVDGAMGRRPAVKGTDLDVWEIVETVAHSAGSIAEAAAYFEIDRELVETAMRYYRGHRDEIDAWIERVHEIADREEAAWEAGRRLVE
jgi:uncharacterized protein (DUF433 family)